MFNNLKVSVPIFKLLPTETVDGILETHISVVNPTVEDSNG